MVDWSWGKEARGKLLGMDNAFYQLQEEDVA
jgi:hypothetical protein